jgi:hypothetical protein
MVRRMVAMTAGLALVAMFGFSGVGSASPRLIVKNGQQWTIEVDNGGGCELFNIGAKHTWSDPDYPNDYGTYSGGGKTINVHWGDKSLSFTGDYFASATEYIGLSTGNDIAQLVEGHVSTWDGVTC